MCLAMPGKIIQIEEKMATVDLSGTMRKTSLQLVPEAKIGDYVLLHAGFAIQVMDESEALETLKMWEAMSETLQ
ncbi:HypC/HybG/HupF family hydrogenase formation chaperone [Candidatus Poribacteria bacterium]|nr:HypC/HybG/HupF family hydrogenase formation chaperone [Candidatus Poribacteria bacterium]